MNKPKQAPWYSMVWDLLVGRLHSRVIELTQKVKGQSMKQHELETRLREMGQQMTTDIGTLQKGLDALRAKADDEGVDFSDELATLDEAAAGLHRAAESFATVGAGENTGTIPSEATAPVPAPVPDDITGVSGATPGIVSTGGTGQAVDAQPAQPGQQEFLGDSAVDDDDED